MLIPIKDFDGYYACDDGNIYCDLGRGNRDRNKRCTPYKINLRLARNGYARVTMRSQVTNKRVDKYVHRLIAEYFVPNPLNKGYVNHIDCNRSNNKPENLEWVTLKENNEYSMKLGNLIRDEKTGRFYSNGECEYNNNN